MVDIPPDVHLLAIKIRNKYSPEVRAMNQAFFHKALEEAELYQGCYITYWVSRGVRSLFVYRKDRQPTDAEVLVWAQELFGDGQIHREIGLFHVWCVQGDVYTMDTIADMVGREFADAAAKTDSNAGAFDLEKTEIGKKILRRHKNGVH